MSKKRVLITGAAGHLGPILRRGLADLYDLRLFDIVPIPDAPDAVEGDMLDVESLCRAMDGVEAVVHLAAEARVWGADFYSAIVPRNIIGTYNLYEAARRCGVKRVVFASSFHVFEGYSPHDAHPSWPKDEAAYPISYPVEPSAPARPDSLYAVSKVFGEALARYYADYHGVSSVCLRLGAASTASNEGRARLCAWSVWLSERDLCQLVQRAIEAEGVGCIIVHGSSRNTRRWVDLEPGRILLGYEPQDDAEPLIPRWYTAGVVPPAPRHIPYAERLPALPVPEDHVAVVWVGQAGYFLKTPASTTLYVDLFLGLWPDRLQEPLLEPADVRADLLLVTHGHRDHLDVQALPVVARHSPGTRFVGPSSCCRRMAELGLPPERLLRLDAGDSLVEGDLEIIAVPARHQEDTPDAVGYVLRAPGVTLYHTGDSEYDPVLLEVRRYGPDALFVPINGWGGNMTAEQAARLAAELGPQVVVPMHYGMFVTGEDLLSRFLEALAQSAPDAVPAAMEYGAILYLPLIR